MQGKDIINSFQSDNPPSPLKQSYIKQLNELCHEYNKIITIEEGTLIGGFGSAVNDFMRENKYDNKLFRLGIPDKFIEHGDRKDLLEEIGLTLNNVCSILKAESLNEEYYEH